MQKVVGSNPIIRFSPAKSGLGGRAMTTSQRLCLAASVPGITSECTCFLRPAAVVDIPFREAAAVSCQLRELKRISA
jgi:hypothetical protein